jgi:hypothetical protein
MHTGTDQSSEPRSRPVRGRPWNAGLTGGLAVVAAMSVVLATFRPVQAAVFRCPAGDVACLIAAIKTANGNGEDDTITLKTGTYTLTVVDNTSNGSNGLPSVTSPITIRGAGADRTIIERDASTPGFRILHVGAEGVLQLEGLTVRGGVANDARPEPSPFGSEGGGILNFGEVKVSRSRLTGNNASNSGGGVFSQDGVVTMTQSIVANNHADAGGGLVSVDGTVQITETSFLDNNVSHPGGAVWTCGGTATIVTSVFARNGGDPSAIVNNDCDGATVAGPMTIVATTIADSGSNSAGGLFNSGTMLVVNSAIVRNRADAYGAGGIENTGSLTLINTTVAANLGSNTGGIENSGGGSLTLVNTTVADNSVFSPEQVGGLANFSGGEAAVLVNTILARNTAEEGVQDCLGPVTSRGHNVIGDPTGCTVTLHRSDLTGAPGLGSLVDDGTSGHAHLPLLANSRAIDRGDDKACPPTDQLGQPRVRRCDIGAIEFQREGEAVQLDIKPGSSPNRINPKSHGVIPVAILTTDSFDATTVDPLSVRFGPKGAQAAPKKRHIEDVNHDDEPDLVLHFKTRATGIQCGDTSASLTGETFDGDPIQGSDAIQTVRCKP